MRLPARSCDGPGSIPKLVDLSGMSGVTLVELAGLPEASDPIPHAMSSTDGAHEYTNDLVRKYPLAYKRAAHHPHWGSFLFLYTHSFSIVFQYTLPLPNHLLDRRSAFLGHHHPG